MADSVLHNITPDSTIFVYNTNVSGSESVANYYATKRGVPSDNLIAVTVTSPTTTANGCDVPITKTDFETNILLPLRSSVSSLFGSETSSGYECMAIILGYGMPLAYEEDDGEIIAIASRLHRLNSDSSDKLDNPLYDRRGDWRYFNAEDSQIMCITAVIDGPTADAAKTLIDRSIDVDNQTFVAGKIYIDPYGNKITDDQIQYQTDILDFVNNSANNLGLDIVVTTDEEDPYLEPTVAYLKNDSFYWGWYEPTYSKSLFLNQNEKRVFLYNADDSGACKIHFLSDSNSPFDDNGSDPWCNLAINVTPGYASTAGSVSGSDEYDSGGPGEDAYLRPRPFFESLQRGASLGEAFLFASPYVNWKIILIGDPLMTVMFPVDIPANLDPTDTEIDNNEAIRQIKEELEIALGWAKRQTRLTSEIVQTVVDETTFDAEIFLLQGTEKWRRMKSDGPQQAILTNSVVTLLNHIERTEGQLFSEWLVSNNEKTTELMNNMLNRLPQRNEDITSDLLYPEGQWHFEFVYIHPRQVLENVHFEIELSKTSDFSSVESNADSSISTNGWKREVDFNEFVNLTSFGLSSNLSGFRIRYTATSSKYLTRTESYYVRWKAKEAISGTDITDWAVSDQLLIVER